MRGRGGGVNIAWIRDVKPGPWWLGTTPCRLALISFPLHPSLSASLPPSLQRAAGPGGGDGAGHRHVLSLPAGEGHEELPSTTRGVSQRNFLEYLSSTALRCPFRPRPLPLLSIVAFHSHKVQEPCRVTHSHPHAVSVVPPASDE